MKAVLILTIFLLLSCAYATGEVTEQPLSIKEDGGRLYAGYNWLGNIRVFDSSTLELLDTFPTGERYIFSIETDSNNIYYGTDLSDKNISKTASLTKKGSLVSSESGDAFVPAMLINGEKLYACEGDKLKVYSLPGLKLTDSIENGGRCKAIRVDDKYVYTSSFSDIVIWDKTNLREVKKIANAHTMIIRALWNDKDSIYSVADDGKLKIWSKADFSLKGEKILIYPWALTGDDSFLYATSREKIYVLDKKGSIVETLNSDGISAFDLYSSDGYLYSAHDDGAIKAWDKKTFQNTVTSETFQFKSRKWQILDTMEYVFYALLVIGIIGFVAVTIAEKKKKGALPAPGAQPSAPEQQAKPEHLQHHPKEQEHPPHAEHHSTAHDAKKEETK